MSNKEDSSLSKSVTMKLGTWKRIDEFEAENPGVEFNGLSAKIEFLVRKGLEFAEVSDAARVN